MRHLIRPFADWGKSGRNRDWSSIIWNLAIISRGYWFPSVFLYKLRFEILSCNRFFVSQIFHRWEVYLWDTISLLSHRRSSIYIYCRIFIPKWTSRSVSSLLFFVHFIIQTCWVFHRNLKTISEFASSIRDRFSFKLFYPFFWKVKWPLSIIHQVSIRLNSVH